MNAGSDSQQQTNSQTSTAPTQTQTSQPGGSSANEAIYLDLIRSFTPPKQISYRDAHLEHIYGPAFNADDPGEYILIPPSPESISDAVMLRPGVRKWVMEVQGPHGMPLWIPQDTLGTAVSSPPQKLSAEFGADGLCGGARIQYTDAEYEAAGLGIQTLLASSAASATSNSSNSASSQNNSALLSTSSESAEWTRAETDRLVDLWNRFGGRIPIIADRFNASAATRGDATAWRPIEDIRERLVQVLNRLADLRQQSTRRIVYEKGILY